MWLIFLDESKQADPPRDGLGELVAVGAVLVPEDAVATIAADLARIRAEFGVPDGEELKWKPPNGSFLADASGNVVGELRRRMLQAALDRGCRTVVVVWDRGRVAWDAERTARTILGWLYERIERCLRRHDNRGIIIADKPSGGRTSDDTRWLTEALELTTAGTEYVTPERVVLPILTAHSHLVPHLQLADLLVGAATAGIAGRRGARHLAPLLQQLAHTDARGIAADTGIKLWPPDLKNLHYWVFGESRYQEATWDRGFELPAQDLPYATDEGLPAAEGSRLG